MTRYIAVVVQTRVKECFDKRDVTDNLGRAIAIVRSSAHFPYGGMRVPNRLFVFDAHAHNHDYSRSEMAERVAIRIPGPETAVVQDAAKELGAHIATSALEFDPEFPETFFTCCFIAGPDGTIIYKYRKVHTHLATEKTLSPYDILDRYVERYGRGRTALQTLFPVADTPLGRIGMLIAHDRMYPEAARAMAMNGAEILILGPQPEPSVASGQWEVITRSRAIENMTYVLAPNYGEFISEDRPRQRWAGHSMIVDGEGAVLASCPYPGEAVCAALVDMNDLRQRRADAYDSPLAELRSDVYRQIYADTVYPPNRNATTPPGETRGERLAFFGPVYEELVRRGAYTRPTSG